MKNTKKTLQAKSDKFFRKVFKLINSEAGKQVYENSKKRFEVLEEHKIESPIERKLAFEMWYMGIKWALSSKNKKKVKPYVCFSCKFCDNCPGLPRCPENKRKISKKEKLEILYNS